MNLTTLLEKLGYSGSPNFLWRGDKAFDRAPDFGHIFRHAAEEPCRLRGVYSLRSSDPSGQVVPIVYVCEAETELAADDLHRLVWNQDVVPFVLVYTPSGVKLYSGFRYHRPKHHATHGILQPLTSFNQLGNILETFQAASIDEGRIWKAWGSKVTPQHRVYWNLLKNLQILDTWLQKQGNLPKEVSHALIGKYVYLHYLRDRQILSPRKMENWGIPKETVFGRTANRTGLAAISERLEDWLNGRIFDLKLDGSEAPADDHIGRVAATFAGDEIIGDSAWQLHLDFLAYDFSYIPIETLSMIYEQFLHAHDADAEDKEEKETPGRKAGAYYTPLPVVNFMLSELEERHPLRKGMKVCDPACGSGAFLVQCYRRLIEKEFPPTTDKPAPYQLKELLQQSIYGVDSDADACSVSELSLLLTLLDYVEPPDLENNPRFKLPALRGQNIFCADFFSRKPAITETLSHRRFDWVIGNPPWKRLNPKKLDPNDEDAWAWMQANVRAFPVGRNQLAQAFAWSCPQFLQKDGECALLLPAMCLFEDPSRNFRAAFMKRHRLRAVANFANLAEDLFARRSRVPAAAFFFRLRDDGEPPDPEESVLTYSPLVANQEATRPVQEGTRNETWSLMVNGSEIREVPLIEVRSGSGLPWKLATWGSAWDSRLLSRLVARWPKLKSLEAKWNSKDGCFEVAAPDRLFGISQGLELCSKGDEVGEVCNQRVLDVTQLEKLRNIFAFPKSATSKLDDSPKYVRQGRKELPLAVCRPPHVVVSAARIFSVYTEEFLVVPPRQIGIISLTGDKDLLKALALYLSSDFAFYHQFLSSTEFGVKRDRATLAALRQMPVPFIAGRSSDLADWTELHRQLAATKPRLLHPEDHEQPDLFDRHEEEQDALLAQLNKLVSDTLGLDDRERALVHDLVHVRLELKDGNLGKEAVRPPQKPEMETYARCLKRELDDFVGDELGRYHEIAIVFDDHSGMVALNFTTDHEAARKVSVRHADNPEVAQLEKTRRRLCEQRAQWVYFNRNLRIYEGRRTYILKPMQRFHWTESQAMVDAGQIIAETSAGRLPND
jgi:hypothetical protein